MALMGILRNGLCLVLIAALASGCTGFRPVSPEAGRIQEEIKPGDRVRVVTRDFHEVEFQVREVTEDRLVGDDQEVPFGDIRQVERRVVSPGKTTGLAAAIVVVALIGLMIYALSNIAFMPSGSP